ncbi:uncharacterized protein TRFO_02109 [Tritrichomonas foetus]|uniref:Saposin B-type domain-containing protein n=1 Tax=Tritrichomonas foetus TaxID=1144522 RepID=A0A1J4JAD1_9EUKA|nr:uncharacterized protein TRFO_02109 [Tritrichomonas foetus]|eukprot:OHS95183.1 uncharacterized protein TRFO_02109 [Tritrichomonas foetus]
MLAFLLTLSLSRIKCNVCMKLASTAIEASRQGQSQQKIQQDLISQCVSLGSDSDICTEFVSKVSVSWIHQADKLRTTPMKLCVFSNICQNEIRSVNVTENMGVPIKNSQVYPTKRPFPEDRRFRSDAVENQIRDVKNVLTDEKLSWMFENCFPNTLDTTVYFEMNNSKPDTFVITGDIDAMWLRDSGAQVFPYVSICQNDFNLQRLIAGVVNRQVKSIQIDPYANGFTHVDEWSEWKDDYTDMKPYTHERKYEIDSLCYPIRLAHKYWKTTGDTSIFDEDWQISAKLIVQTFKEQQRKDGKFYYTFQRKTERATDTINNNGRGSPINPVGLIVSFFRPSDDSTTLPFLIPSNFFAVNSLRQLAEISKKIVKDFEFASECLDLADEVEAALKKYAVVEHPKYGKIYAYEVDGYGSYYMMDDANVPSLLSLPYLTDMPIDDPIYQNTRKFVWSLDNPYFFKGKKGEGIGGPHIGYNYSWPMSIIMRALTSQSDEEIRECVKMLRDTDGDTGFMHESFLVDDPTDFTRKWFAWANTLFGELIVRLVNEGKVDLLNNLDKIEKTK